MNLLNSLQPIDYKHDWLIVPKVAFLCYGKCINQNKLGVNLMSYRNSKSNAPKSGVTDGRPLSPFEDYESLPASPKKKNHIVKIIGLVALIALVWWAFLHVL